MHYEGPHLPCNHLGSVVVLRRFDTVGAVEIDSARARAMGGSSATLRSKTRHGDNTHPEIRMVIKTRCAASRPEITCDDAVGSRGRGAAMRYKTRHGGVTIRPEYRPVIKTRHGSAASRLEITRGFASVMAGAVVRSGVGDDVGMIAVHKLGSLRGVDGPNSR